MKTYLTLFLISTLLVTATSAFAFGGWGKGWKIGFDIDKAVEKIQLMFEKWAKFLGLDVEKIKNYWAEGLSPKEIMEKEGISEEKVRENIKNLRLEQLKEFLQKLVDKGIITKEQMEKRLTIEKELMESCQKCKFFPGWFGKKGWRW